MNLLATFIFFSFFLFYKYLENITSSNEDTLPTFISTYPELTSLYQGLLPLPP